MEDWMQRNRLDYRSPLRHRQSYFIPGKTFTIYGDHVPIQDMMEDSQTWGYKIYLVNFSPSGKHDGGTCDTLTESRD